MLTLIYGVNVDQDVKTSSFSDVNAEDAANGWAIKYIEAARRAGLLSGMGDNTFHPGEETTLGQFATGLVKGLDIKVDPTGSPWYSDAVKKAVDNNILPKGTDGSKLATRVDLVVGAYGGQQKFEEIKQSQTPTPTPTPTPSTPSTPQDTTAPSLAAATVNNNPVTITNGNSGSITLAYNAYLTSGTITSDENATFSVTSIQGVNLTNYSSLSFTQQLTGGSAAPLNLITFLDSLDPQGDGVSVSYLKILGNNTSQMVVSGTLTDAVGNTRQVSLKFHWN